jgi:hypothetical protein
MFPVKKNKAEQTNHLWTNIGLTGAVLYGFAAIWTKFKNLKCLTETSGNGGRGKDYHKMSFFKRTQQRERLQIYESSGRAVPFHQPIYRSF